MNHWASMLRDLPAGGQRLIARANRISLPRAAAAEVRLVRLRQALCHAATVRETYLSLDQDVQTALQDLRSQRGGLRATDVQQRYGPIRPWRQLAVDRRPRNVAEQLVLLGWLLERPAAPQHPARYALAPELRRWLPRPLTVPAFGPATLPARPLALHAASVLLLASAERPLDLRADGGPRRATSRLLAQRLPLAPGAAEPLAAFLLPLLRDLGLVAAQQGACALTPAGQRFLALPPAERLARLRHAWRLSPVADAALAPLLRDAAGINWPYLRDRLCDWVEALPADRRIEAAGLYDALAAAFGPLADTHTHGFRYVDRAPWQPRRAAALFDAALCGPLAWLGFVAWEDRPNDGRSADGGPATDNWPGIERRGGVQLNAPAPAAPRFVVRPAEPALDAGAAAWRYGEPGALIVPHAGLGAAALRLQPFVCWERADVDATTYRITGATLARARGQGWSAEALWELLADQAGARPPEAWRAGLDGSETVVRITHAAVVMAQPAVAIERALRARSVRRYVDAHPAPGIVLAQPEHVAPLARALQRQKIATVQGEPPAAPPPTGLTEAECASLLVACAFYQAHAPDDAPLPPNPLLEERLRAALPPRLRATVAEAIAALRPPLRQAGPPPALPPSTAAAAPADPLPVLRQAIAARRMVELTYDTGGHGAWTQRTVRPLTLERRGDSWYLSAYCTARGEERTFRVDRIGAIAGAAPG
ncbi:MAG: WYL domain-containing protein [Kouleothrix sp.]|nr:WYL domain-containing protein [Kouleothrix sp.]